MKSSDRLNEMSSLSFTFYDSENGEAVLLRHKNCYCSDIHFIYLFIYLFIFEDENDWFSN